MNSSMVKIEEKPYISLCVIRLFSIKIPMMEVVFIIQILQVLKKGYLTDKRFTLSKPLTGKKMREEPLEGFSNVNIADIYYFDINVPI